MTEMAKIEKPHIYEGDDDFIQISYSHEDRDYVYEDIRQLAHQGFRFWYDEGIAAGTRWNEEFERHMQRENCRLVIFFLSENSIDSAQIRREMSMVEEYHKPYFTVNIGDNDIQDLIGKALLKKTCSIKDVVFINSFFHKDIIYIKRSELLESTSHLKEMLKNIVKYGVEPGTVTEDDNYQDIEILCTGVPYFLPENVRISNSSEKCLYLAFPPELAGKIPESAGSFSKNDVLFRRLSVPGIDDKAVWDAVEKARRDVAHKYISRGDGLYFNGSKYGIAYSDGFARTSDAFERPVLTLEVFNTDHFTHRVVSEAVKSLDIDSSLLTLSYLNGDLQWIRASFGVSVIVLIKSIDHIILTERSVNASFTAGKPWIYVSVTEAFSDADKDRQTGIIDLASCVKRGVFEELGITPDMYADDSIRFYDSFFETNFYQDNIVASIELKDDVTYTQVQNLMAKDKFLEVGKMFLIKNERDVILEYIREHHDDMRSQTIFSLESYVKRL